MERRNIAYLIGLALAIVGCVLGSTVSYWLKHAEVIDTDSWVEISEKEAEIILTQPWELILMGVGFCLMIFGLSTMARAIGRSAAWGLCAFLSVIGIFIVLALHENTKQETLASKDGT